MKLNWQRIWREVRNAQIDLCLSTKNDYPHYRKLWTVEEKMIQKLITAELKRQTKRGTTKRRSK